MKYVIVGGVAAGAGAAARLRRLDENAEIVLLERGKYISFANCGLPYHIGGIIEERDDLLVMPEQKFRSWFNVDVRTGNEVSAIDRAKKTLEIRRMDGSVYLESYDKLLLATGSSPVSPDIPGSGDERVLRLWTIPDMDKINAKIASGAKDAVVIGGGFIGLEAAENLRERGLDVTIVQHSGHVLPTLDCEMASLLHRELESSGIRVKLNSEVTRFRRDKNDFYAGLNDGTELKADLVILSIGVKPNSELAVSAKLETGKRGHIVVNANLQTSDPDIYAAGDAIEVLDPGTGSKTAIPLAGPANKQGRIAADNLAGGSSVYKGTFGASVIKVGRLTAATVGWNEAKLMAASLPYHKIYTHPASNAGYYPTSSQMHIKLLFAPDGKIYGAQIVGISGVDKRIDTIACAIECGKSAPELAELEFAYAPPFNSAKDPVNFLGMIAQNILSGLSTPVYAENLPENALILDVREPGENSRGSIPGAVNLPLGQLRKRLAELDRNRSIVVCCQVGLRGYLAERILKQNGFNAYNLSGGYLIWRMIHDQSPDNPCGCLGLKRRKEN